jgi:hypothetical protein
VPREEEYEEEEEEEELIVKLCQSRTSRFIWRTNIYVFINNMCLASRSNVDNKDFQKLLVHITMACSQLHYRQ